MSSSHRCCCCSWTPPRCPRRPRRRRPAHDSQTLRRTRARLRATSSTRALARDRPLDPAGVRVRPRWASASLTQRLHPLAVELPERLLHQRRGARQLRHQRFPDLILRGKNESHQRRRGGELAPSCTRHRVEQQPPQLPPGSLTSTKSASTMRRPTSTACGWCRSTPLSTACRTATSSRTLGSVPPRHASTMRRIMSAGVPAAANARRKHSAPPSAYRPERDPRKAVRPHCCCRAGSGAERFARNSRAWVAQGVLLVHGPLRRLEHLPVPLRLHAADGGLGEHVAQQQLVLVPARGRRAEDHLTSSLGSAGHPAWRAHAAWRTHQEMRSRKSSREMRRAHTTMTQASGTRYEGLQLSRHTTSWTCGSTRCGGIGVRTAIPPLNRRALVNVQSTCAPRHGLVIPTAHLALCVTCGRHR